MFFRTPIVCCRIVIFVVIIIFSLLRAAQAYNLNVKRAKVFSHPHQYKQHRPNYFGFTVALYNSPNFEEQSVIVGAPRANTTQILVNEPGTVYKCTLSSNCTEWSLDNTFGEIYNSGIISRHNSWLGASLSVENKDNPKIVVCSPRWKIKWGRTVYMPGICYHAQANAHRPFDKIAVERVMPFTYRHLLTATDSKGVGYHKYGMASLGFSLNTFSKKGQWYGVLGAPGAHNSHGESILLYQNNSRIDNHIQGVFDTNHQYLGYSITSGNYFGNEEIQYAAGAPRTNDMRGEVRVYDRDPVQRIKRLVDILDGPQIGEYFGASLTSCDIDNNGKDEIIVGAPMWTNKGDEGNVYIFTTGNTEKFSLLFEINGNVENARFGSSVMCLDDLDRDGYKDIAIGAPYEDGHGAIYIYNGNRNGLSLTWSQKISGDEFPYSLRGFGISISQPRDIDGNGYFDVAVGAHQSDHVVVLRSQPVVVINLEICSPHVKLNNDATSFPIQICCTYKGARAPKLLSTIIRLEVDAEHERAYMTGLRRESRTYSLPSILVRRESNCQNLTVLLKERNPNVIDPVKISASVILDPMLNSLPELNDFYFNSPLINKDLSKDKDNITLEFAVDCGSDNVCDSNITLDMMTNLGAENRFVTGSTDAIKLFFDIHNYGEAAYQTLVHIFIPESMALLSNPVNCKHNGSEKIHKIICPIGNPLVSKTNFTVEFVMKQTRSMKDHVGILTYVTTQSNNLNPDGSTKNVTIHFVDDVDITVFGNAHETSYFTFDNEKKHMLESIKFQHVYKVRKFGVTPIMQSHLTVSVPTHIINHERNSKIEIALINPKDISLHETTNDQNSYCVQEYNNIANEKSKHFEFNQIRNNYTLYIDCTNRMFICTTISCFFETSSNLLIIGGVTITMELKLKNLTDNVMNETSTISFISNGHIRITSPTGIIQKPDGRPDDIQTETLFDSSRTMAARQIPIWIIALSVLLGILLLALLTYGLIKFGFFNRKKKEELEALKSDETKRHTIILETTSSTEILDQE